MKVSKTYCSMCGRELNVKGDIFSTDCAGDCWGCVGECEYDGPNGENEWNMQVYDEIKKDKRDNRGKPLS